jgi:hypothetical protein
MWGCGPFPSDKLTTLSQKFSEKKLIKFLNSRHEVAAVTDFLITMFTFPQLPVQRNFKMLLGQCIVLAALIT